MAHAPDASVVYARLLARARLRHLQLMVAINDHGHLRHAAEAVGVSQPAATQALAELEQLLDLSLFERHAKGMRTTAAGQVLIPLVRQMLLALQTSTDALVALRQGHSRLRLGMLAAAATALAPVLVRDYLPRHPGVQLELSEDVAEHLLQALVAGGLDLVLSRQPQTLPASVRFEPLFNDHTVVLAGVEHPLGARRGLRMVELGGERWMRAPLGIPVRQVFDTLFASADTPPDTHPVSTTSVALLIEILRDQRTLALVPRSLAQTLCNWGLAQALDVLDTQALEGIGLLTTAATREQPALQALVAALKTAVSGPQWQVV